jgi:uncharacterized spore protein YtfJ
MEGLFEGQRSWQTVRSDSNRPFEIGVIAGALIDPTACWNLVSDQIRLLWLDFGVGQHI